MCRAATNQAELPKAKEECVSSKESLTIKTGLSALFSDQIYIGN
ncbi:hypothetical protein CES85_4913 [Ochrobactrum quorumnocens]|uniref:Uncharacterized protein n=1 Tax=Ochrobactrum quorumnocens TaxID=271865 RepID=A0A248UCK9_9HYPH|nr:hypothetical protein CES85_4913 [[Ochrobactrum] quorumnocens]